MRSIRRILFFLAAALALSPHSLRAGQQAGPVGSALAVSLGISADALPALLQAVEQTTPLPAGSIPAGATVYSAQQLNFPPLPGCAVPSLSAWELSTNGVWLLDDAGFDYSAAQSMPMSGMDAAQFHPMYEPSASGSVLDTNGLWLDITNVVSGVIYADLHNATDAVYAVWCTTNLPTIGDVEAVIWPTNSAVMPFTVETSNRQSLFMLAEDWTGVTQPGNIAPNWWLWEYFGTASLSDLTLDGFLNIHHGSQREVFLKDADLRRHRFEQFPVPFGIRFFGFFSAERDQTDEFVGRGKNGNQ